MSPPCAHRHCHAYPHSLRPAGRTCCYRRRTRCPFAPLHRLPSASVRPLPRSSSRLEITLPVSRYERASPSTSEASSQLDGSPLCEMRHRPYRRRVGSVPIVKLETTSSGSASSTARRPRSDSSTASRTIRTLQEYGPASRSAASSASARDDLHSDADTEVCSVSFSERAADLLFRTGRREMDAVRRIWKPHRSRDGELRINNNRRLLDAGGRSRVQRRPRSRSEGCLSVLASLARRHKCRPHTRTIDVGRRIPIKIVHESVMVPWRQWNAKPPRHRRLLVKRMWMDQTP